MPIYEFLCTPCNRIYSFHSFRVATDRVPTCPKCGATDLKRVPSRFGVAAKEGSGDAAADLDDPKMEREMMRFADKGYQFALANMNTVVGYVPEWIKPGCLIRACANRTKFSLTIRC